MVSFEAATDPERPGLQPTKADPCTSGTKKQNTVSSESHYGLIREPGHTRLATMLLKVATS